MLEVVNKTLWARLKRRFSLEDFGLPFKAKMDETIHPVTNADELLITRHIDHGDEVLPSATGLVQVRIVPDGKRWLLRGLRVNRTTGAAEEFDEFHVVDNITGRNLLVAAFTATDEHSEYFATPVPLEEKWSIWVNISTHNASDGVTCYPFYDEEEAFVKP